MVVAKCRNCVEEFNSINNRKYCEICRVRRKNINYINDKSTVSGFLKALLNSRTSPERKEKLTLEDLITLYNSQNGLCALSGVPMTTVPGHGRQFSTNISIDRINSSKGYELNNIQLTCMVTNLMKHSFTETEFLWWCKQVINHHGEKL